MGLLSIWTYSIVYVSLLLTALGLGWVVYQCWMKSQVFANLSSGQCVLQSTSYRDDPQEHPNYRLGVGSTQITGKMTERTIEIERMIERVTETRMIEKMMAKTGNANVLEAGIVAEEEEETVTAEGREMNAVADEIANFVIFYMPLEWCFAKILESNTS